MMTWTEIHHHQPAQPYLGLPRCVVAAGVVVPAGDGVGQLPGGHLAAEVGVLGDHGEGAIPATEDDGGGADLGEEESVEEEMEAGGLETNRRRDVQRKLGETEIQSSDCQSDLDRAVFLPARVYGEPLPGLSPVNRQHLCGGGRDIAPNKEEPLLQYCAGVGLPGVEGVLIVEPAGPGQLVAGGLVADRRETLEEVQGRAVGHVTGEGGEAAAGPRRPQLH